VSKGLNHTIGPEAQNRSLTGDPLIAPLLLWAVAAVITFIVASAEVVPLIHS